MDRELLAERRLRGAQLALAEARRELERTQATAERLDQRMRDLERELDEARRERRRLRELLSESERARRRAEQHAHSERAQRERLEEVIGALERDEREKAAARLRETRLRVRELERELLARRREADELRHLLAAATTARRQAEQRAGELEARLLASERQAPAVALLPAFDALLLRAEGELARRPVARVANGNGGQARPRAPSRPLAGALEAERALLALRGEVVPRKGEGSSGSPGDARSGVAGVEAAGAGGAAVLAALARELSTLASLAERQRQARIAAEARAAELERELRAARSRPGGASEAIGQLRSEIEALLGVIERGAGAKETPQPGGEVGAGPAVSRPDGEVVTEGPAGETVERPAGETAGDAPAGETTGDAPAGETTGNAPSAAPEGPPPDLAEGTPAEIAAASRPDLAEGTPAEIASVPRPDLAEGTHAERGQGQAPAADPAGPVAPERLSAALTRLRETTPPRDGAPEEAPADSHRAEASATAPEVPAGPSAEERLAAEATEEPTGERLAAQRSEEELAAEATEEEEGRPGPSEGSERGEAASGVSAGSLTVPIPPPAPPPGPWLREAFRALARDDPPAAGALVLALLPLQSLVHPEPLAYDIVLSGIESVQVTIDDNGQRIGRFPSSRSLEQLNFRVSGDVAQLGRLLAARRLRRRFGRGLARVEGSWRHFRALEALLDARVRLRELPAAGVELPAQLTLQLIAAMLSPQLTGGAELTLAHRDPAHGGAGSFLSIRRGGWPQAGTIAPGLEPSLTIWCARQILPAVLDGGEPDRLGARVEGAVEQLAALGRWLEAAQDG